MCRAACAENGDGRRPREPLECGGSARVAELVDAPDLGSGALGRVGSSPTLRTKRHRYANLLPEKWCPRTFQLRPITYRPGRQVRFGLGRLLGG